MPYAVIAQKDEFVREPLIWWMCYRQRQILAYRLLLNEWLDSAGVGVGDEKYQALVAALGCALDALVGARVESEKLIMRAGGLLFCFEGSSLLHPFQGGAA